ncbi:hypothetical protein RJ639_009338 [Escallonia herrerae]|uniref:KIB1-4 beta-propeller domain-containing protein n=1 Tax=Escallonia herrerae TaxID=1293975 RepID=A0AA88VR99_9ASTE|nr:hypothetical protein RJ639_009338 [Escallonia herrerae]
MGIMLDLPHDLLVYIAEKVDSFEDFVALGGVCKALRSAATKENFSRRPQIPWLMLAQREDGDVRGFYSLSKGMIRTVTLPEANDKRCRCLASEGWLITAESDWSMTLLHPLSRRQIRLPHMSTLEDHDSVEYDGCIWKAVLSSSPSSSDCTVMIIQGCLVKLAFCKPGINNAWTTIETKLSMYFDVIHFNGNFYAVDGQGNVLLCDVEGANPTIAKVVAKFPSELQPTIIEKLYLVESSGKLLVVSREGVMVRPVDETGDVDEDNCELTYGTTSFQVFEVDLSNDGWTEVKNLGNRALFLGHNSSFSVEASHECVKANCIYFADDCMESYYGEDESVGGGKDMGIYNLRDGSFTPHFTGESYSRITPPMWVAPSF